MRQIFALFWGFVAYVAASRILLKRKTTNSIVSHKNRLTFGIRKQKTKVITLTLKKYNYENDGIKPNDRSPLQQLCIGKQRVSREPQEGSEENFDVSLQVPHVHQPRISPVR